MNEEIDSDVAVDIGNGRLRYHDRPRAATAISSVCATTATAVGAATTTAVCATATTVAAILKQSGLKPRPPERQLCHVRGVVYFRASCLS
ncbi:MAG: hypothetical protein L7F77_01020 [Candidatus Magnetominusculus sp. LBB02]|nr:hypothetical protein [Candidatus Magnetominusculus sp. LBB02]